MKRKKLFNLINLSFLPDSVAEKIIKYEKFLLYVVIGGGAVVLDVAIFWLLTITFDFGSVGNNTISIFLAMLYSFALNAKFNFKVKDKLLSRFASFVAVTAVGYIISSLMLIILSDVLGFNSVLVKIASLPVVLIVQYLLNSIYTFKHKSEAAQPKKG